MSPRDAIAIAKRARKLLRAGRITHRELVLVDTLLWCCRSPTTGGIVVSYTALQRLCRMGRATIAKGLRVLERLRVLTRIRRRVRSAWRSLQATNRYVLHPVSTEFHERTVSQNDRTEITHVFVPNADVAAAQATLARRRAVIEGRLLAKRRGSTAEAKAA